MSFLAGRLAGKEGAYFFQESKQAVGRLVSQKKLPSSSSSATTEHDYQTADVLSEVLRHSLPSRIFRQQPETESSLDTASKWALRSGYENEYIRNSQALNPIKEYVSLPQVTMGPKRWQLPDSENSVFASTANELRRDRDPVPLNPEKLKAAAEGLTQIGSAFAIATAIVFGCGAVVIGQVVSKLQLQNSADIRTKVKDLIEPKFEGFRHFREQLVHFKASVENVSKKWHLEKAEDVKEKPLIKALNKMLGVKASN